MKLNKREQLAFDCLQKILNAFKNDKVLEVSAVEINAVREVFGIDLRKITYKKSQIAEFKRGKDKPHMILKKQANIEPFPYGYFPFQVKKDRAKERAEEVAEIQKQETERIRQENYFPIIDYLTKIKNEKQIDKQQIDKYEISKAKRILTSDYYDYFNLTEEEKANLLDLIVQVENAIKEC